MKRNLNLAWLAVGGFVLLTSLLHLLGGPPSLKITPPSPPPAADKMKFNLQLQGSSQGGINLIQSSTNLLSWETILSVKAGPGEVIAAGEIRPTNTTRFFRVLQANSSANDTNPPTWTNGLKAKFAVTGPSAVTLSWEAAVDDVGVAQYLLYLNGVRVANVLGTTLSHEFTLDLRQSASIHIQAADASGNLSAVLPLALIPGHSLLAASDDDGRFYVFSYLQTNAFQTNEGFTGPAQIANFGGTDRGLAMADYDRDGILDIIAARDVSGLMAPFFLKGNGDGTFAAPVGLPTAAGANGVVVDFAAGDFDSDGNLDFVVNGNERYLFFYWGNGDGTFTVEVRDRGCCGRGMAAGDFNEDGREDFVRGTYSDGRLRLFLSNGDRTFVETNLVGRIGDDPYGIAVGDFDEDGHLDVIASGGSRGDIAFFKGFGDATFTNLGVNGVWTNLNVHDYSAMDAYDYNGDGHLDLVMSTYAGHSVYFWPGNGDGTFGTNRSTVTTSIGRSLGISAPPRPPRVEVGISPADPVINLNGSITFTPVGAGVRGTDLFRWTFGDEGTNPVAWTFGPAPANLGAQVTHAYTREGRFLTRLWHADSRGIQSVRATWATVKAAPPVANPGGPYNFGEQSATQAVWSATLDASGSTDDFGIDKYIWSFGDGTFLTNGPTVSHNWTNAGVWNVGLTVIDKAGQSDTKTKKVTFTPGAPPVAEINGSAVVDERAAKDGVWSATFYATNSTDDFGIWKYAWNFGNGQTAAGATGQTTYKAAGTYVVTLIVTDHANQTNQTTFDVTVKANSPPVPVIQGPHLLPEDVATNGLWFGAWNGLASTDDTGISRYDWNFGDGATAAGTNVTHTYAGQGVYPLALTLTDNGNQTTTVTQNVIVVGGDFPVARISASTLAPEGSQPVALSGRTSTDDHGIYLYRWFLPPERFGFTGKYLDPNQWQASHAVQDNNLIVTGAGGWGTGYFFSIGLQMLRGGSLEGRVDTSTGAGIAIAGVRNLDYGTESYGNFIYGLYFNNGELRVYERGSDRGPVTNYTKGNSYDFRIETKPDAGARYFLRASGAGDPFVKVFETANFNDATFSFGADVHTGVFGFDDLVVDGLSAPFRDLTTGIFPGGTIRLQVVDNALQTNSTTAVITPLTGAPPQAVINGPSNGLAGVEIAFNAYGSSDDYAIASYTWDFGDGTPPVFGPAVTHRYNTAGSYTNTLTVADYAGQIGSASLLTAISGSNALVAVPWLIVRGVEQPHETYAGKTNTLKAVARGISAPFTNVWDFGDGTGSFTNVVTNTAALYNLEASHIYNGAEGTPFYATARTVLTNGSVLSATYPIVIRAKTLETEEKAAIDEGLWFLHKVQNRYDLDANNKGGDWTSAGHKISPTASSVHAFAVNGHLMTDDGSRDPYVDTVQRGVNYLLTALATLSISPQAYGDPDGNHNGIALTANSDRVAYETGPVMDALVTVGRPELVAPVGGPNVKGRTFRDIMQDMLDSYCWGQFDDASAGGGWRYSWQDFPDNSASQWGAIGMFAAERLWGIAVPDWVKARNLVWVNYSRGGSGFGYTGPGDGEATTPSALVQLAFDGTATTNALWRHGEDYVANNWSRIMGLNNVYANYAIAKAFRTAVPQAVHNLAATGKDWFLDPVDGLARVTINHQFADGSWTAANWVEHQLATPWSILILSSSLFQQGPVAVINVAPNPSAIGAPVIFDARGSYHQHPGYKIVEYRWIFDSSKGVDFEHPDAVGPVVTNVFGALGTNTVILQVRDNNTPHLSDTASAVVRTTVPPYPPTADAGGPYVASVGQDVHLDGSGSFTVDAASGNFIQSWDWQVDLQRPLDFNQGVTGPHAVITNGFATAGPHQIGLRVKNANSIVYPGFGLPDLTADAFTTVFVYDRVIDDLRVRPKDNKSQLTWTKAGDYAVVIRSQLGPDRGFEEIGRTESSFATFLDTAIEFNTEYFYRVYVYQNGRPDPIGVSDPVFVVSPPRSFDEHAPRFVSTPVRVAKVGELYNVQLEAKDLQNNPLTFSLLTGPTNLTLNPATGEVRFTPTAAQIGNQLLSFQVTNKIGRDVLTYTLFVFPASNHPPVVNANGPYAALTGVPIQFSSAGTLDPDGDPLFYFWNFGDGTTSTNPNPSHAYGGIGDYLVTLFANDGLGGTASARTRAQITRPNRPPVATVSQGPNFTVRLGERLDLDGSGSFDLDGDPLSFTWIWGDGAQDANAANTASHFYSTPGAVAGRLVVADNHGATAAYDFNVNVQPPNQAPIVVLNVSLDGTFVGTTITFDATSTRDPENDPLSFEFDFGDRSKTTGSLVTHTFQQIGDFNATLIVRDNHGGLSQAEHLIHVFNRPPVFNSNPLLLVRAGTPYTYTPLVSDVGGDTSTFELLQGPAGMSVDPGTGTLNWLPGTGDIGPNPVILRANDSNGGSTDQSFMLIVTTPAGPQIDLLPTHIVMTNVVVDSQTLDLSGTVRVYLRNDGPDGVPIPFTVALFQDRDLDRTYTTNNDRIVGLGTFPAGLPAGTEGWIEMAVRGTAFFKDAPLWAFVDSDNAVPEFNEGNNLAMSGFDINTNQPPVIDLSASYLQVGRASLPASATLTARLGNSGFVTLGAHVPMAFYDGDPGSGGILIGVGQTSLALIPGRFEDLSVTWDLPAITKHTVFVVAGDAGNGANVFNEITQANNRFSLLVDLAAADPPVASAGPNQNVNVGDTVFLNGRDSHDPQGKALTYHWSILSIPINSRARLIDADTVNPSFLADAAGRYALQLIVNNGVKDSDPATVQIAAVDTNIYQIPAITSKPSFQGMVNVPYEYQLQITQGHTGPVTFRLAQSPPGMIINTNSGLVQWTPTNTGTFFVQVVADGPAASTFQSYSLTILGYTNLPPRFTSAPVVTASPDNPYIYNAVAVDPNRDPVTYGLTQKPSGMSINPQIGVISWTPTSQQMGANPVSVTADDGHGGVATQSFNLVVLNGVPGGPLVRVIPDQTVVAPADFATIPLDQYVTDASFPNNQIVWTFSGAKQFTVTIDSKHVATISYPAGVKASEQITFLATDPAGNSGYSSPLLTVRGVDNPPVAAIANLSGTDTTSIDVGLFELKGTADDIDSIDPVAWRVLLYDSKGNRVANVTPLPVGPSGWHEGRVSAGGSLGTLDFSLIQNGTYTLLLEVQGGALNATATAPITLDTPLKIGQVKFSQRDLVLPVAGVPLQIIRNYDSLNLNSGDFGYSWSSSVSDLGLTIGEERADVEDVLGETFSLRTGGGRDVTVTMPDTGRRVTFRFSLVDAGFFKSKAVWTPPAGVNATLAPTVSPILISLFNLTYWQAAPLETALDNFDFPGFILTTQDGTQYRIDRENLGVHLIESASAIGSYAEAYGDAFLSRITEASGNHTDFVRQGTKLNNIVTYDRGDQKLKSVLFQHDSQNRISAIYTPENLDANGTPSGPAALTYEYDATGNLVKVNKLIEGADPSKPSYATTTYLYGNSRFPHYITEIKDPRGVSAMRMEFDSSGRLIGTIDANGNRSAISHDISGRTTTIFDRQGNPTQYVYDSRGNVVAKTDPLGRTSLETYDAKNNPTSITDPLGNTTKIEYDASSRPTAITDPLGQRSVVNYDAGGHPTSVTDALGHVTTNLFDAQGHLIGMVDPLGRKSELQYDGQGRISNVVDSRGSVALQFIYDAAGNPTRITPAFGPSMTVSYDQDGHPLTREYSWVNPDNTNDVRLLKSAMTYDAAGRLIRTVDPMGLETATTYDELGDPVAITDPLGNVTTNIYDLQANLIETVYPDGSRARSVFDENNRVLIATDRYKIGQPAFGTRNIYDAAGQIIASERHSNVVIEVAPVTVGSITSHRSFFISSGGAVATNEMAYDLAGRLIAVTNEIGQTTRYEYDAAGHKTAIIDTFGHRVEFQYAAAGRNTLVRDALGRELNYIYDAAGRVTRTVYPDGSSTLNAYDEVGRPVGTTDAAGRTRQFQRDAAGLLTGVALPAVSDPERANDAVTPLFQYTYDAYGNLRTLTDPKGRQTQYRYDQFNRPTGRTLPGGESDRITYDQYGRQKRLTDFKDQTTEFLYDQFGRLIGRNYYAPGSGVPAETLAVAYDEDSARLDHITDAGGTTRFSYDAQSHVTGIASPEGDVRYEYDPVSGMRTRTWTANSDTRFGYDELNRLKTVEVVKRQGEVLSTPEVTTYAYTAAGSRASVTLPSGIQTIYSYDNLNRLTQIKHVNSAGALLGSFAYQHAPNNLRTGLTEVVLTSLGELRTNLVSYGYDNLDRLISETATNAADRSAYQARYSYDLVGNRLERSVAAGGRTLRTRYFYDADDRLLMESNSVSTTLSAIPAVPIRILGPDGKSRVILHPVPSRWAYYTVRSVPGLLAFALLAPALLLPWQRWRKIKVVTLDLDPARALFPRCLSGFMAAVMVLVSLDLRVVADEAVLYSALTTDTWGLDGSVTTYQYDANGSIINKTTTGPKAETVDYGYDLMNRLVSARTTRLEAGSQVVDSIRYAYNPQGTRVRSEQARSINGITQGASTNIFVVDSVNHTFLPQVLEELPAVGAKPTVSYTLGADMIGQEDGNGPRYFLPDGHGSNRLMVDASGFVTDSYAFDGYGMMLGGNPTAANPAHSKYLYTGEQFDQQLGQYYLRARTYDPGNGRFTRHDPLPGSPNDPPSLHHYLYANDNPVNRIDPTGQQSLVDVMCVVAIISILASLALGGWSVHKGGDFNPDAAIWGGELTFSMTPAIGGLASIAISAIVDFASSNADDANVAHAWGYLSSAGANAVGALQLWLQQNVARFATATPWFLVAQTVNLGFEILSTATDRKIGAWWYWAMGPAFGRLTNKVDVSVTFYGGVVWGVPEFDSYSGYFQALTVNIPALGTWGATIGWFRSPSNDKQFGTIMGVNATLGGSPSWGVQVTGSNYRVLVPPVDSGTWVPLLLALPPGYGVILALKYNRLI